MNPFQTHGACSWAELQTTDAGAAANFYTNLFGWTVSTMEMDIGPYTVVRAGDLDVGGIMARQSENIPPHWAFYITVHGIDSIAKRVAELGGQVFLPVMDIPTVGRFCGLMDPQGAMLMAIEYETPTIDAKPSEVDFTSFFKRQGTFSWIELRTPDLDGSINFYSELFGWTVEINQMGMGPYGMIHVGEVGIGGMCAPMSPDIPSHWGGYVTVDDVDTTSSNASSTGGTVIVPPMDIPDVGRFSVIQDPQGAVLTAISYVDVPSSAE